MSVYQQHNKTNTSQYSDHIACNGGVDHTGAIIMVIVTLASRLKDLGPSSFFYYLISKQNRKHYLIPHSN